MMKKNLKISNYSVFYFYFFGNTEVEAINHQESANTKRYIPIYV